MGTPGMTALRKYLWAAQTGGVTVRPTFSTFFCPEGSPTPDVSTDKHARNLQCGTNNVQGFITGARQGSFSFSREITGLHTNRGDGEACTLAGYHSDGTFLQYAFGDGGSSVTGDTTAASPGTGTDLIMDGTPGASAEGKALIIKGATSGVYNIRMLDDLSTATYTMDRRLKTVDGNNDTPEASEVCYAPGSLIIDNAAQPAYHLAFAVEGEDWRRELYGCVCNGVTFNWPSDGSICTMDLGYIANDWDWYADQGETFSAPSTGTQIINLDADFMIGETLYHLAEVSISVDIEVQPIQATSGTNGRIGYKVVRKTPKASGKLLQGGTADGPFVPDDQGGSFEATGAGGVVTTDTKYDVAMQIGRSLGSIVYARFPRAQFSTFKQVEFNGMEAIDFELVGTGVEAGDIAAGSLTRGELCMFFG